MLYEYAVEPSCLGDWQTFRYLMEQFGVSHGRLISQFPRKWKKTVIEDIILPSDSYSFQQKQKAIDNLKNQVLMKCGRAYNQNSNWLLNAFSQHKTKAFQAIILKETSGSADHILVVDEIDKHTPLWSVSRERKVARTTNALGEVVGPLLQISDEILFVDKMFHPINDRWRDTLERFIQIASNERENTPLLEYHCGVEKDKGQQKQDEREFQEQCERYLTPVLPANTCLTVTRWDQHKGGDFFHGRYILTDKGGIQIDWGLDRSMKRGETTDVSLMDHDRWKKYWDNFHDDPKPYRLVDRVTIHGK